MTFKFHPDNTLPAGDWIFTFGSNEAGKHGKGAERVARVNFRAEYGVGQGPTGHAFALPIRDRHLKMLPLANIEKSVEDFLAYAKLHQELNFFVTHMACAAGEYSDDQIGPLFARAPENCSLPDKWRIYVSQARAQHTRVTSPVPQPLERERSRCPYCGHLTFTDQIKEPVDNCHHEMLHSA